MRIGLNLLYLLPGVVGGTETYAVSLLGGLAALPPDHDYVVYVNRESADLALPSAPNVTVVACPVRAASRARRYAFEQLQLPRLVRRDSLDVLHSLGYVGPLAVRCPHVVTVHDLIYVGFRDHLPLGKRLVLRLFVRSSVRRAARVIAVSTSSKAQIVADVGVPADRVCVVHEAGRVWPGGAAADAEAVLERHRIRAPYVVAFSSLSPSKNLPRLVEAFARIADRVEAQLVLIGHLPPGSSVEQAVDNAGPRERVRTTGFVPDADLAPLIGQAALFAFPSLYEGFGLPVLDAQSLGVPVVCSSAASLPEVAGDGALFIDPQSVVELADALLRGLTDEAVRADLVARGHRNAERFSWDRAARETVAVYEQAAAP
ncbi:MAG: glycosyltransferase family 1 protein [Acidimicrobiales bacterium]|nr:glycosyltransferase family 1 protein [Acidimicrobiales bacterium]